VRFDAAGRQQPEAGDALRVAGGEVRGDPAAHGTAAEVNPLQTERVEKAASARTWPSME
jgi:hypothetical protein